MWICVRLRFQASLTLSAGKLRIQGRQRATPEPFKWRQPFRCLVWTARINRVQAARALGTDSQKAVLSQHAEML